ncbi:MAG TPA: 4Fe-4S binding protein [Anaerolineaceae bacterium]
MTARLDLTSDPWVRRLLVSRWPQFLLRAGLLAGFLFTILAGLLGSPIGSSNFAIIFVWIAWWSVLKLVLIPFGGRSWCAVCPIPMPGEWLRRGGILESRGGGTGLGLRWPRRLRGSWLQSGGFLLIGIFGALTLTTPSVTGYALLGIFLLAFVLSLVFEPRAFCKSLCPIGGFTGLYAQAGPVEVRVKDRGVCERHAEKICFNACPWGQYPLALQSSANCGLCMECLRACPADNLAVNLRPWGADLGPGKHHRLDGAFLGLVMLASALVDSAVFLGPWGGLKLAAYQVGSPAWWGFAAAFLTFGLAVLPGIYALAVWAGQKLGGRKVPLRSALAEQGQVLIPLGLMGWIAFTISFASTKFAYVLPVLSDPLGWGWNLFGTAGSAWVGQDSPFSLLLQVGLLISGLFWACRVARQLASSLRQAAPMLVFCAVFTLGMLWLLIG